MTLSTQNTTPPKSTTCRNSNFTVHIQTKSPSQFEFVLRDTKESEYLDLGEFRSLAFAVETVIVAMQ